MVDVLYTTIMENTPVGAIEVAVLIALLGLAAGWGTLRERVKTNREQITSDRETNREDHQQLFNKFEELMKEISKS